MSRIIKIDQVSSAFSGVPGVTADFLDKTPTGSHSTSSTSFVDVDSELNSSFVVEAAGKYFLTFHTAINAAVDEDVEAQFQLLLDDGESNEQVVGGSYPDWTLLVSPAGSVYERAYGTFFAVVELTAGSHTIKPQWKKNNGSTIYVDTGSPFVAKGFLVSGSGIGGILADSKVRTSSLVITGTASPDAKQLDSTLTLTFTSTADERVLIVFVGTATMYGTGTSVPRAYIYIDDVEKSRVSELIDVQYYSANLSMCYLTEPLSAGVHTAKFYFTKYDAGSPEWRLNNCHSQYLIFRGGQIPIKKEGVLVAATQQSLNFTGAGVDVTNNNGDVNISMMGPVGPTVDRKEELSTQTISAALDVGGKQELTSLARTITTLNNENIELVFFGTARMPSAGASNGYIWFEIDDVIVETHSGFYLPSVNFVENVNFTVRKTLSSGSHTIKCYAAKYTGSETNWQLYSIRSYVVQSRGGYSYPENTPILEYNSASVVNVKAPMGCPTLLRATLNNGREYSYDGTLTVDLTVSGRGGLDTGSEASSTWYYVYLVPNATDDALSVVCSASAPSTGPTGFLIWKYQGPIRNDGSSNIIPFKQISEFEFRYISNQVIYSSGSAGYIEPEVAYAAVSVSAVTPATANAITIKSYMETNAVSGELWLMEWSLDGANLFTNHAVYSDSAQKQISEVVLDIPLASTNLYRWRNRSAGTGNLYWTSVVALGWKDAWLAKNRQTTVIKTDIENHATTHKHGGVDEVATATSAANAIPKALSTGVLDPAWIPGIQSLIFNDLTKVVFFDDFIGYEPLKNWFFTISGGGYVNIATLAGGIMNVASGDKVNEYTIVGFGTGKCLLHTKNIDFRVKLYTNASGTRTLRFGIRNGSGVTNTDMHGFYQINAGNLFASSVMNGGAATDTDAGETIGTTAKEFRILTSATDAKFYINGVLKATHTVVPTALMCPFFSVYPGDAVEYNLYVDYCGFRCDR